MTVSAMIPGSPERADLLKAAVRGRSLWDDARRRLFRNRAAVAGMVVLAAYPGYRDGSIVTAAVTGAVLGLVAYGTYDLTNLATLKMWSPKVTVIDMAWGTFVTACSSAAACAAMLFALSMI